MNKILLVEDDLGIVTNLTQYLKTENFIVKSVSGQKDALDLLEKEQFNLILLDISLSDGNGFTLCKAIKESYNIPVIFLTASSDEYSTVTGFDLGADDYISKPFRPRVLVSRIRNILRLTQTTGTIVQLGNIVVDTNKGIALKNGKDIYLSALEYRLLLVFINHKGQIITRNQLFETIWDIAGEYVSDNTLSVYIKRLREKIEDQPSQPQIIKTVRGIGYRMD